ncbi:MAG: arsenate reductase ArsC [Candidatus Methanomethylicia archaeon]
MEVEILGLLLFVCVENTFRSQIAEAYFNTFAPEGWKAISAGVKFAENVHPNAIKLMSEEGIDISFKKPKLLTRELQENVDMAVIVCSGGECPLLFVERIEEWGLPDPAKMSLEEARAIRDLIKSKVLNLIERIKERGLEAIPKMKQNIIFKIGT